MIWRHMAMALSSIGQNKLRSLLTMLGIIIGVSSVVTVIALGAGIKKSVSDQVASFGTNLIQINPGQTITKDEKGNTKGFNFAASIGTSTLTESDVAVIAKVPGVAAVSPAMLISGVPQAGGHKAPTAFVLASYPNALTIINRQLEEGAFINQAQADEPVAVIGHGIAEKLFPDTNPIGKTMIIRRTKFTVVGQLKAEPAGGLKLGPSLDDAIYLPFNVGKSLSGGVANILEIDVKVADASDVNSVVGNIRSTLKANHGGEEDFTALTAEDQLKIFDTILNLLTSFVAAIAGISLLVGGIGVMNIMFVSVTERTREIGVRKAIGASNRTILLQFMVEAVMISLVGGMLGVGFSLLMSLAIKALADITPVFTIKAFVVAVAISVVVGVIFGTAPAAKAARKNPIQALRYE